MKTLILLYTLLLMILLTSACDKQIKQEVVHTEVVTKNVSCTYTGFCFACGLTFNGKYECSAALRPSCPGNQFAEVQIDTLDTTWQKHNSTDRYVERTSQEKILKEVTPCD